MLIEAKQTFPNIEWCFCRDLAPLILVRISVTCLLILTEGSYWPSTKTPAGLKNETYLLDHIFGPAFLFSLIIGPSPAQNCLPAMETPISDYILWTCLIIDNILLTCLIMLSGAWWQLCVQGVDLDQSGK